MARSVGLLAVRAPGAAPSPLYPQPGEVRDSILVTPSDGLPVVHPLDRAVVRPSGILRRPVQTFSGRSGALIVTDARTAVASSDHGGDDATMLVGHVRHSWLDELVVAGRGVLRLRCRHPGGARLELAVRLVADTCAWAVACDISARASRCEPRHPPLVVRRAGRWSATVGGRWW